MALEDFVLQVSRPRSVHDSMSAQDKVALNRVLENSKGRHFAKSLRRVPYREIGCSTRIFPVSK